MNSPRDLIESQFPSYFLEQYPQFVKFIEEYYDFLESSIAILDDKKACKVGDILYGSLSKAKAIVKIIADDKIYFDYETQNNNFYKNEIVLNGTSGQTYFIRNLYKNIYSFARDIEENTAYDTVQNMFKKYFKRNISLDHSIFSRLDPNTLTKKILDYYKNRGTENSYYWFFRIFFDDVIDLYYPKVDILRLSDTYHVEKRWMQIKYKPENNKFEKTRIKGSKSKATATVRGVQVKSRNNQTRSFLDLIYINGAFEENEEIIGYDIITGDELTRSNVLKSIIGVEVADGGIGHKVKDEFSFSDGIGQVSHLEKYSVTNIKINNPGVFYAEGDYVQFDNAYTGATTYANAHIETVHSNHALSDYINFLNNSLKLDPSKTYEKTSLYEHIESNTNLLSTSTNNYYKIYGSIDKLKINKSGLNYKFEPRISVLNTDPQAQNLYLYELYIDTLDVNTYSLTTNSIVSIDGEPAFYAGSKYLTDEDLYFEGLANSGILAETPYVDTFYAPANLSNDIANTTLEFFSNATSTQTLNLLDKSYDSNTTLKVDIINFATYFELGETAKLEPVLGYGVSKVKITDAGLLVNDDNEICFIDGPQKRDEVSNNLMHPLDTSLNYKYGILLDPIEEYIENNSNLSSEKHIQDNYYYQSFSYEITTKIPAEVIEPLLLDELHPAGFIAFIRNKIDEEVSMHLKVQEFPRIEMLSENNSFELEVEPYIVQMQEKFINMNEDALIDYVEVELDNEQYADTTLRDSKVEPELENVNLIDVFEGFRLYVEDCLIRPDSKSFQEFRKCDLGPFFDYTDLPFFDDFGDTDNSATFDSDGSCIPTGYGTSKEYSRLEKEMFYDYSKFAAFDSFYKIISVEDQANWLADPINRYTGTIGSRYDFEITNHKAVIEEVLNLPTLQNKGGKIVIRDSLGSVSNFLFDNEFSYFDANLLVDISLNFSGEAFNFTPNPVFYFDSTDANNLIYDFSSNNTINLICSFPQHEHFSFNFSNEPKLAYESVVSGNTLESRGSYLPTAEILTKRGYIQIQEVRLNDQVAVVNDDGTSTWKSPNQVIRQKYTGIMYKFSDYNRMSITVTPSQDLVVYRENQNSIDDVGAKKVKASRLNINKSIYDRFAIVDSDLVGTYNNVIKDYIPIVERIHRETVYYDGDVYCLVFNELSEAIEMEYKVNNIDIELLQFHSKINNDYTLPKFEPIDVYRTNHTQVKNHITVDIEKQDFVLYLPTSNSVLFDFNTNKDNDTYVSFKSEAGITNATKILNYEGPSFDNVDKPRTFDADKRFTFDNTGQRFQVNMERMYLGSNHVLTKVPVGQEQEITYTKELNFDYFSYIDGNLPKDCLDVSEDKQEFLVSNVNNKTYSLNMLPDTADVYLNSTLLYKSKDYEIIGNTLHILILLNLNDVITVYMKSSGTCNTMPVELYTYEMLNIKPQEIKFTPKNVLITEKDFLLYPKEFGPPVTFDLATLSPPGCLNGSFDYFSANNISAYKFDSNTGQLSFDYDKDPCVTTQAEKPLDRYITFDSFRRTFDQTNDFYIKTEQYIEPEQILTNANDSDIVNNKQNQTRLKTNGAEIFKIGETMGSSIVATIKNFRVDLKKKFFDSLIWTFDRDYTYERLNPREHSGFDSAYEPGKVNYECIDLFFDSDDVFLDTESIGYVVRKGLRGQKNPDYYFDNPLVYFDQSIGIGFSNEARPFNSATSNRRSKDPCVFYTEPFPYDDATKNISLDLELNYTLDAYGPYNLSKSFDSAEPGHGFDKDGYPLFDNEQGGKKPFVTPENVIINVDARDVSVASGRNDPLQTLIMSAEDAYSRELTGTTEQVLVNWAQIVICTRDVIYEEDVISDFEFNIIRPFLADGSCDPSSTKGTYVEPDYLLINRPNIELFTEVSENPTILYDEASFIDATVSDAHTLHTEIEATYDIFSCDPIRYTDIIYEYRRDRISPYILDTCPGDDRILRSETDFEYTLLNEYTYYANTQYYEPHEIEIYSHAGNDLYPDKAHLLAANNTAIVTFEYPEIEVAQHLGSRNCAISNAELVDNYLDVNILDCHLKEVMRYWIGDTVYTTKTQVFSKLELQSNTETILNSYENDVLYLDPLFIDATSTESEYKVDQYFDMEILDRNPHIWLGQMIGSKLNQYITEKSYPKTILDYVKDKIPSVSVEQETEILHPREFKISNTVMEDVSTHSVLNDGVSYIDASIVDENKFIQGYHTFIKDRNVFVNVKDGLFTTRLKDVLDDYLLSRRLIDYEGDTIPSVKALGEQVLVLDNFANAMFFTTDSRRNDIQDLIELNSTVFSLDTIHLDSTVSTAEQSKAVQDRNVPDRNKVVSTDKRFNLLMLEEVIEPKDLKLTILDYSKDHIPTVSVDSRPSFKQYRTAYFDFSANTTSEMSTIGDKNHIYIDATTSLYEFDEIEDDTNLLSDINFISPDDIIGTYYEYPILDVYKKRIRENRYDTSRTVYVKERHEFEIDNRIKPNPLIDIGAFDEFGLTFDDDVHKFEEIKERAFDGAHYEIEYQQDTILYQDDALNVDASNEYEEFDEIEYDRTICDLHSVLPLDEKVFGTLWEYYTIFEKDLKNKIVQDGRECIETVRVDPRPNFEVERTIFNDLQSNTKQEFTVTNEDNYLFIDATTYALEEFNNIETDSKIGDLYSIIPLDEKVKGTIWEYHPILDKKLKYKIAENSHSYIQTVTIDSRPSIEYFRAFEHNLERSLSQVFTLSFDDMSSIHNDALGVTEEFDEVEFEIKIPDRHRYFDLSDAIFKYFDYEIIADYLKLNITEYDKFAIPTVKVESEPNYSSYRTYTHDLQANTKQDFTLSNYENNLDVMFNYTQFNEIEYQKEILNFEHFFDLNEKIRPQMFDENLYTQYGLLKHEHLLTEELLKKIILDRFDDINTFNVVVEEPHIERIYDINGYFLEEHGNGKFTETSTIYSDIIPSFIDASITDDPVTNEYERDLVIWNDRQAFSLADLIEDNSLYEKLDTKRGRRIIDDFSIHNAVITSEIPHIIIRPVENVAANTTLDEILSGGNFEQFIDATFTVNDYSDSMVDKLIHNLFEDLSRETNDPEIKLINRPIEYANTAIKGNKSFIDTIITAEHFEKFIDSSMKDQELFSHININPFAELKTDANNVSVENILINRPNEYANTAIKGNETFIDTILKGGYYEKFIDSSATVCSELYQYNDAKVMNVVLKDVSKIPWFSTNSSNVNVSTPLNNAWSFSTNSSNTSQTNTIVFFSTGGPDYQVDLTPTYIDMALATSSANANNGFLTANGWQYIDQKDPLPLDANTFGFVSNRTIQAAMFEKIEFVITDIANTHNGYYFAVGTSPWFDDNREANVMFGSANGVTYELDGVIYTDFNKYKTDFTSGLKANAKITFAPTLSIAQLLGSDANTVNGANSDLCPTYDVYTANTYTFYYWSNANNDVYSAGGEVKIYELNNLEECVNYSLNKTSYIDNIRSEKEFICA